MPGRIFPFDDAASDIKAVRQLLSPTVAPIDASRALALAPVRHFCELGCGSGNHLIVRASMEPEAIFFGIELRYKRVFRTIEKAERAGLTNVYALKTNARDVPSIFPERALSGVYVNFPDPWEKIRARKHRLLQADFLTALRPIIVPGGFVSFKTDHREYFETVLELLKGRQDYRVENSSFDLHASDLVSTNVRSEFEELFLSQGLPVFYCKFLAA